MSLDHAPTPWVKGKYDDWRDASGERVAAYGVNISSVLCSPSQRDRDTAEFMFLAVNAYDDMLAALKRVARLDDDGRSIGEPTRKVIREAIAKAEGRP